MENMDMDIISEGKGELVGWHDPDDARELRKHFVRIAGRHHPS